MLSELQTGVQAAGDSAKITARGGRTGEAIVSELHGRYTEQASRGLVFSAANPAAQAVSVALATTYTGICLTNPAGSGKNLAILRAGFSLTVAPAAIANLGLMGGFGAVTHTTPLIVKKNLIDNAMTASVGTSVALVDSAATIPTPVFLEGLMGGFTAAALPSSPVTPVPVEGSWVVPPGGFLAVFALTAVTGYGHIVWEEVPI